MTFPDFLAGYWWVLFPLFGMLIPIVAMIAGNSRAKEMLRLMQSYAAQGKEPPPELLAMTNRTLNEIGDSDKPDPNSRWWSVVAFTAIAGGFGTAYWFLRGTEDWAWVFLAVTVGFAILAVGGLLIALFGRKA